MKIETSSKDYWKKRWEAAPNAPSWDDKFAVDLENHFIQDHLPKEGPYLELGCGNGDLVRLPEVGRHLLKEGYTGLDANTIVNLEFQPTGGRYLPADLTAPHPEWFSGIRTVISKRTLQNLSPVARRPLLELVALVPHGLLIEDYYPARSRLDRLRHSMGLPDLPLPIFNWPLYESERGLLPPEAMGYTFLGRYYSITRTIPACPSYVREWAWEIADSERRLKLTPPPYGPVVAFVW